MIGSTQAFTLRETPRADDLFLAAPLVEALRATGLTAGTEFAAINAAYLLRQHDETDGRVDSAPGLAETDIVYSARGETKANDVA